MSGSATLAAGYALEATGISKTFRRGPEVVRALIAVDLAIGRGEVVGLTGPSGSGKTTLLNVLCGWEAPDEGTICFRGSPIASPAQLGWEDLAIVAQDLALLNELSIEENVALPLRLTSADPQADTGVASLLERFGLAGLAPRLPEEASLGEQQRAALARALVVQPEVLLADEPVGHQDEEWTKIVMQAIREVAGEGTACLIATHDPETWPYLDRIVTLHDGVLDRAGSDG